MNVRTMNTTRAAATGTPKACAAATAPPPPEGEMGAGLLARARAGVVHALCGCEGSAAVGAGREEDVVVAESVVLPGDEELAVGHGEARVPLVRRRAPVDVEPDPRAV